MKAALKWMCVLTLLLAGVSPAPAEAIDLPKDQYRTVDAGGLSLLATPARLMVHDVPLVQGLVQLHRSSGVNLVFSPSLLPSNVVTCRCEKMTVGKALEASQLFAVPIPSPDAFRQVAGEVCRELGSGRMCDGPQQTRPHVTAV